VYSLPDRPYQKLMCVRISISGILVAIWSTSFRCMDKRALTGRPLVPIMSEDMIPISWFRWREKGYHPIVFAMNPYQRKSRLRKRHPFNWFIRIMYRGLTDDDYFKHTGTQRSRDSFRRIDVSGRCQHCLYLHNSHASPYRPVTFREKGCRDGI